MYAKLVWVLIQTVGTGKVLFAGRGLKVLVIKGTTTCPEYASGFGGGIDPVGEVILIFPFFMPKQILSRLLFL
jgi:hypothetical protein